MHKALYQTGDIKKTICVEKIIRKRSRQHRISFMKQYMISRNALKKQQKKKNNYSNQHKYNQKNSKN